MNYDKWLSVQKEWFDKIDRKFKKSLHKSMIIMPIASVTVLAALGFGLGGIVHAGKNAFWGLIFGIGMDCIIMLLTLTGSPGKGCLKNLNKEIKKTFPQNEELEIFAEQMLGTAGKQNHCIKWANEQKYEDKVEISRDYAIKFTFTNVNIVKLKQVKQMELDMHTGNITISSESATVRTPYANYNIRFFYYETGTVLDSSKKKKEDVYFAFSSRDIRDKVAKYIEEISKEYKTELENL